MISIASHNSWSYLPVKQWWLRPFTWVARCQHMSVIEQFEHGVRCFDLRLRYDRDKGKFRPAHGLACFHGVFSLCTKDVSEDYLTELRYLNIESGRVGKVWCRVLLEDDGGNDFDMAFYYECQRLQQMFPHIAFFGGWKRSEYGRVIYPFDKGPSLDDRYGSVTKVWKYVPWPWLYAKTHNRSIRGAGTDKDFLFIDYIDL